MLCFHAAQTGKHLLRTENVSEQIQKHFLCPGRKICVRNKCCARANGETFVSATMSPRLKTVSLFSSGNGRKACMMPLRRRARGSCHNDVYLNRIDIDKLRVVSFV